ncbi:hypothetical protein IPG36_06750 [bacterium]|nr:MAG: hypothetical protein IPG36_06750 [bacterium]
MARGKRELPTQLVVMRAGVSIGDGDRWHEGTQVRTIEIETKLSLTTG